MRVALDTNGLYTTQAGVARYIRGLLRGLPQVAPAGVQVSELAWAVTNFDYRQPQRAWRTFYREILWARLVAPRRLAAGRFDLYHATVGFYVPPPRGVHYVVTLHDLAVLRHPERFRRWQRRAALWRLRRTRQAERVICISQFTASEAMQLLGLSAARIEVVYNGCDFHPGDAAVEAVAPDFPVPSEFFLFVGSLEPGKNLELLRAAYARAAAAGLALPPLLIVGARRVGISHEGPPPAGWHYLGHQPDAVLLHLYRHALALVFPSKYEGFGLPVAEAMALGCPVICSPVASLPEIAGDAARFAELTPEAYAQAMHGLARDERLRGELAARGLAQAGKFSWRKCAQETLAVYRQILEAA